MRLGNGNDFSLPHPSALPFLTRRAQMQANKAGMDQERQNYFDEWRDISEFIQLRRGRYLQGKAGSATSRSKPRARTNKVLNEAATLASRTCGAGMLAGVSSPAMPWLKLKAKIGGDDLSKYDWEVKAWLDIAEMYVYEVFSSSNYYHVKQNGYRDMADFGQGPILIDEDFENVINCYCSPPGEYYLAVDHKGVVDTMYREMQFTTLQLMQKCFNNGGVPREVRWSYDKGNYNDIWNVTSVHEPNYRQIVGEVGLLGRPYISMLYCDEVADDGNNAIMGLSGIHENPISAPRWDLQPGDVYATGPGSLALPTTKSLQILEKKKGQMVDKMAVPPTQGPDTGDKKKGIVNHMPGGHTTYPSQSLGGANGRAISPLYEVQGPQLQAVHAEEQILENRIDKMYFVDLFLATIESDRRQVTATEIAERHEEKLIALGPVLERTHYEGLNIDVKRVFGILMRHNVLPPPPESMAEARIEVEYTSTLAVAQKAVAAGPIERFAGFVGNLAGFFPDAADKMNVDSLIDEYADAIGVAGSVVNDNDKVEAARQQRAQQQQNMEGMAMAREGAETARLLSETDTTRDDSNLLADILGNQGRIV